jgi:hypothetical protein
VLVASLGGLNRDMSSFILKVLEADHTGTHWPHSAEEETALAERMEKLSGQLKIHAQDLSRSAAAISGDATVTMQGGEVETSAPDEAS